MTKKESPLSRRFLPVGKLPEDLLAEILSRAPMDDPQVVQGPGIGLDNAIIEHGDRYLVLKSDPITFATQEMSWYLVQINANDIATSGALPRWLLLTVLLPSGKSTQEMVEELFEQVYRACRDLNIALIGGHTEITGGLPRPIMIGTMIGEVEKDRVISSRGAQPGDRLLLTKGVPIEATAILAREFPDRLKEHLSEEELDSARKFLYQPGISVLRDAQIALRAGKVTAMHDPTEGGLAAALWELARASGNTLRFDPSAVPVPRLSRRICDILGLDPLASIASGALLITAPPQDAAQIRHALEQEGIPCAEIGRVEAGPVSVQRPVEAGWEKLPRPPRDEIAKLFEE